MPRPDEGSRYKEKEKNNNRSVCPSCRKVKKQNGCASDEAESLRQRMQRVRLLLIAGETVRAVVGGVVCVPSAD